MYTSSNGNQKSLLRAGEPIVLNIRTSVPAFINCYYRQADGDILKLYPNRYSRQQQFIADGKLAIPDTANFRIIASVGNRPEAYMCLASYENVHTLLPPGLQAPGFQPLPITDFNEIYSLYRALTTRMLIGRVITVNVR